MRQQFERLDLPAQRWPAVDGQDLDAKALVAGGELHREALSRLLMPDDDKVFGIDLTPGALGCALSHMGIWIDIMQRNGRGELGGDERSDVFLVVEDDCEFLPGFTEGVFKARLAEVPEDWQLVFLGGVDTLGWQMLLQAAPGVRRVYNGSRETTAYIINVEGARTALEVCFPLMWQLDTQLTLLGRPCKFNPELVYTTKPMSYIFWPPLVEQNKEDFSTDVQKDEHPIFVYGKDGGKSYKVLLDPSKPPEGEKPKRQNKQRGLASRENGVNNPFPHVERFSIVGSWSGWKVFHELEDRGAEDGALSTEVDVPSGKVMEFQVLCDNDWNQRVFPSPQGGIMLGPSSAAHGNNWKVQVPTQWPEAAMRVHWAPQGQRPLRITFAEGASVALGRTYALVGSWNGWSSTVQLEREGPGTRMFVATIPMSPGVDVEFQVVCNGDWKQRMFPSPAGEQILGPNEDGHGKNWRCKAPPHEALLRVRWDPTGKRSISCSLDDWQGPAVAKPCQPEEVTSAIIS